MFFLLIKLNFNESMLLLRIAIESHSWGMQTYNKQILLNKLMKFLLLSLLSIATHALN